MLSTNNLGVASWDLFNRQRSLGAVAGLLVLFRRGDRVRLLHHQPLRRGDVRSLLILQKHGQHGEVNHARGEAVARLRKALEAGPVYTLQWLSSAAYSARHIVQRLRS